MSSSVPKRFGYSIVFATFLAQALAIGLSLSVYPVFMASIEAEFGVSRTQTSLGIPLLLVTGALFSPWVGRWVDRGSPKKVMWIGGCLMSAGLAALSQAPGLPVTVLLWVGFVGLGQAMLGPVSAMTVIANWFVARRGTMIAISAMGTTTGGACFPPLAEFLIGEFGWRGAILCLGVICLAISSPVVLLGIVKSPAERGMYPDGAASPPPTPPPTAGESMALFLRDLRFWFVASSFGMMAAISIGFITHSVAWATEQGFAREQAVLLLTLNAICAAAGKLTFGSLTDRFGPRDAAWSAIGCQLVGWLCMLATSSTLTFTAGAALFSFGVGALIPCQAGFVGALWDVSRFGRATGLVGLISVIVAFLVPPIIGVGFDQTGSYSFPMSVAVGLIVAPAILLGAVGLERAENDGHSVHVSS